MSDKVDKNSRKPRKMIPVNEAISRWRKDPAYMSEYEALEQEFMLVSLVIKARTTAGLTQEQLAKRMNTSQAVVARLESGRTMPSMRTLERFAQATGNRLKITFEPVPGR